MAFSLSLDSSRSRFRAALVLAVVADGVQWIGFPLFVEGAFSPLDDILDFIVAVALSGLLGWHWEFMPSLLGKLVPGVDMVPLWTLAVASVYRKWKQRHPEDRHGDRQADKPTVKIIDVMPGNPADSPSAPRENFQPLILAGWRIADGPNGFGWRNREQA
jgi:hypothetical protein